MSSSAVEPRISIRLLLPTSIIASACSGSPDVAPSCERYLACILETTPEAYAPALESYGDDSVCWKNDQNAAQCASACDASLQNLGAACKCEGPSCEAVDTVFTLVAGDYVVAESMVRPQSTDGCVVLGDVRSSRWILRGPIDDTHPVMTLEAPDLGLEMFGLVLTGRIEAMQGQISDQSGDEFWGADVTLVADDEIALDLTAQLIRAGGCRSDLLVKLRRP